MEASTAIPTSNAALLWLPTSSLWRREIVRFLRQRSRIVGALATPIVFWALIGSGFGRSFRVAGSAAGAPDMNYLEYSYAGTLALIALFTAVFSMISVIDDRKEGFMQAVIAAPISRLAIVLGKVFGCSTLALGQCLIFLILAPLTGMHLSAGSVILTTFMLAIVSVELSALGFLIAWPMDSTQGFHAIMNLFLIPMWLLSGAFFPASGAAGWLRVVMFVNPMTYAVAGIRHALYWGADPGNSSLLGIPSLGICVAVTIGLTLILSGLSAAAANRN
ncbi:MAG: ABC transporter permease [Planctomycetes bacterium]|nr:ABC transporter permease [Planctomycetota bacterium]MBI3833316.1 ABC transporter permease [Planctomycetota bacterium]